VATAVARGDILVFEASARVLFVHYQRGRVSETVNTWTSISKHSKAKS
jgi:hypothetical protein